MEAAQEQGGGLAASIAAAVCGAGGRRGSQPAAAAAAAPGPVAPGEFADAAAAAAAIREESAGWLARAWRQLAAALPRPEDAVHAKTERFLLAAFCICGALLAAPILIILPALFLAAAPLILGIVAVLVVHKVWQKFGPGWLNFINDWEKAHGGGGGGGGSDPSGHGGGASPSVHCPNDPSARFAGLWPFHRHTHHDKKPVHPHGRWLRIIIPAAIALLFLPVIFAVALPILFIGAPFLLALAVPLMLGAAFVFLVVIPVFFVGSWIAVSIVAFILARDAWKKIRGKKAAAAVAQCPGDVAPPPCAPCKHMQ